MKERLVGAAVLMAAAIILIPEMLSGPGRERESNTTASVASETGLKTYTIDLSKPMTGAPAVVDDRAPPQEEPKQVPQDVQPAASTAASVSAAKPEAVPESPARSEPPADTRSAPRTAAASPSNAPTQSSQAPAKTQATPTQSKPAQQKPVQESAPRPVASASAVPTSKGWAVQLGSFSSQATAQRLAQEYRSGSRNAFVMPVKTASGTLYRVRIGPMQDRAAAEATLREVKARVPGAAVVPHP